MAESESDEPEVTCLGEDVNICSISSCVDDDDEDDDDDVICLGSDFEMELNVVGIKEPESPDAKKMKVAKKDIIDRASCSKALFMVTNERRREFLNGDPRTPFYHFGRKHEKNRSPKSVAETLRCPPSRMVCSAKPRKCQCNAAFILNVNYLDDPDDCLSDDFGPFRHNGQKRWYFVEEEEEGLVEIDQPNVMEEGVFIVEKKYWVHLQSPDFRRRLWQLCDWKGEPAKHVMLEYSFKGEEHDIALESHGNSKQSTKSFVRTEKSTKDMVKEEVKPGKRPSEVYDSVFEEKGGLMKAESLSSLPRQSQARAFKSAQKGKSEKDELWSIANIAKEEAKSGNPFVRFPECSTGNVFLTDDRQLSDLQRFCTSPHLFGVLGVDTVFNCGNFNATPTTYPHLLLVDNTTFKSPTMLGPVSVHKRLDTECYKEKMLYPVRRDIGLGYDYYYNNANESINNSVKRKTDYKRCKDAIEFLGEIREIKDIQQRNVERAVIGEGPYRLRSEYKAQLEVEPDKWFHHMTQTQRKQHIEKLMTTEVKRVEAHEPQVPIAHLNRTGAKAIDQLSVSFEDAGLSRLVHGSSWQKAHELVEKQDSMFPAPGTHNDTAYFVQSKSGGPSKPNYVVMKPNGGIVCDCDKFKETRLCSHSLALAERQGKLTELLQWYKKAAEPPNLSAVAARGAPCQSGQKPWGKRQRNRNRNQQSRNDNAYDAPKTAAPTTCEIWENNNPFEVMFLACKEPFNEGCNAPYNLCLSNRERFCYPFKGDFHDIRESVAEKKFYYHLDLTCVRSRHPSFDVGNIAVKESVRENLKETHKRLLNDTFGIMKKTCLNSAM